MPRPGEPLIFLSPLIQIKLLNLLCLMRSNLQCSWLNINSYFRKRERRERERGEKEREREMKKFMSFGTSQGVNTDDSIEDSLPSLPLPSLRN